MRPTEVMKTIDKDIFLCIFAVMTIGGVVKKLKNVTSFWGKGVKISSIDDQWRGRGCRIFEKKIR